MKLHPLALTAALTLSLFATTPALAEKADRDKPVNLDAERLNVDDVNRVQTFDGNVNLQQGTLTIKADRIVVIQDADGFQKGVATGKPARFKQKREGRNEWIEGEADRIEHDARNDKTEFFNKAWIKSGNDEVRGQYIVYDALTEQYLVTTGERRVGDKSAQPQNRVRAIIQPRHTPQ